MTRLTAISILLYAPLSVAAVWFVDKDNTGAEDGTSWATAFKTIQPAIDAAFSDGGGEVWIAEGTYDETRVSMLHSPPVDTGSLVLKDGVLLFGGFDGSETMLDQRDIENNVTIIDGSTSRSGSPAFHVIFVDENSQIDGFTITGGVSGGASDPATSRSGAGIRKEDNTLTIRNCVIEGNSAPSGSGGGIWTLQDLVLENSTLTNNDSFLSGSAYRGFGTQTIVRCSFAGNSSQTNGSLLIVGNGFSSTVSETSFIGNTASGSAAISAGAQTVAITSCLFQDNTATGTGLVGGAIGIGIGTDVTLTNCVFDTNSATDSNGRGGAIAASGIIGMDNTSSTNVEIMNCTFWGNTAGSGGGAIHYDSVDGFIRNSIFWNNDPEQIVHLDPGAVLVQFNDIQGGEIIFGGIPFEVAGQAGNIDAEPFFVDPENGDFRVFTGSPVIDAGTATGAPATDIAGIPRPQGAGFDMGAHESDGSLPSIPAAQTAALVILATILVTIAAVRLWDRRSQPP